MRRNTLCYCALRIAGGSVKSFPRDKGGYGNDDDNKKMGVRVDININRGEAFVP